MGQGGQYHQPQVLQGQTVDRKDTVDSPRPDSVGNPGRTAEIRHASRGY